MKNKECYAISTDNKVLSIWQEDSESLDVMEWDNILMADLFSSLNDVKNMILELTNRKETRWIFSKYYSEDELKIIKVNLSYEILR